MALTPRASQTVEALLAHLVEHLGSGRIVTSDNHTGTEYASGSGMRWMRGGTKRRCDRAPDAGTAMKMTKPLGIVQRATTSTSLARAFHLGEAGPLSQGSRR